MASSSKHQNIYVDEKAFTHLYENLLYPWTFYVLKNADFDKAITFSNSRVSYKLSAEDYSVEHWFNPIKKGRNRSSKKKEFPTDIQEIDLKSREFHDLLATLNSCLEDDNLRILDKKLIGNEKLTEKDEYIVTGLGKHLIQKLVGKTEVSSRICDQPCPCAIIEPEGACPEQVPLSNGPMYIGSRQTWHGELDLCALGVGVKAVLAGHSDETDSNMIEDEVEGSQSYRKNFDCSQAIPQAIVFGFTQLNRHRHLTSLIPTVLLSHDSFVVLIYDPLTDSLMGPRCPFYFINKYITEKTDLRRYLGIFFLWLVFNHNFFFAKNLKDVEIIPCKFRKKMQKENKIEEYEKLREFVAPFKVTDMQVAMESPRNLVICVNKRKHSDRDNE